MDPSDGLRHVVARLFVFGIQLQGFAIGLGCFRIIFQLVMCVAQVLQALALLLRVAVFFITLFKGFDGLLVTLLSVEGVAQIEGRFCRTRIICSTLAVGFLCLGVVRVCVGRISRPQLLGVLALCL